MPIEQPRSRTTVPRQTAPVSKPSTAEMETAIRVKAYLIWEKAGKPHGRDVEFWNKAKKEIQG